MLITDPLDLNCLKNGTLNGILVRTPAKVLHTAAVKLYPSVAYLVVVTKIAIGGTFDT